MTLEELKMKSEKIKNELNKIEEKKKELQSKQKELNLQITVQEAERATKVMELIEGSFGKLTEENMEAFQRLLEGNSGTITGTEGNDMMKSE